MSALDPIQGILGRKNAMHLLRRVTFGYNPRTVKEFEGMTIDEAFTVLFSPQPLPADEQLSWLIRDSLATDINEERQIEYFRCWLLEKTHVSEVSAIEKLIFFLHTHLTTIQSVVGKHAALYYQNKLFRYYCLGNMKVLAKKICLDNAMLLLLDGHLNDKNSPNENFAREFLELYTIGKGPTIGEGDYTHYTEQDIKAAAQVLSGYNFDKTYSNIDADTGIPSGIIRTNASVPSDESPATRHFAGIKSFSAAFDNKTIEPLEKINGNATILATHQELEDLVNMVFDKKETARNFCRKLYRFFVYYKISPEVETSIIEPLAETLFASNYDVLPVLQQLIKSQHFFDVDNTLNTDDARGAIIKSPLELVASIFIYFGVKSNPNPNPKATDEFISPYQFVLDSLKEQGMDFYEPLDVAGYDAYSQGPFYNRNWISANFLAYRYKFPKDLLDALKEGTYYGFYLDPVSFVKNTDNITDPSNATLLLNQLIETLLPETITPLRFEYFKNLFLDQFGDVQWEMEWKKYIATDDDTVVRPQLEVLFWTLLKSPEFQLN